MSERRGSASMRSTRGETRQRLDAKHDSRFSGSAGKRLPDELNAVTRSDKEDEKQQQEDAHNKDEDDNQPPCHHESEAAA